MIYPCTGSSHQDDRNASIEHVKPASLGGRLYYWNLAAACQGCNSMRSSDLDAVEFYEWRSEQTSTNRRQIRKNLSRYRRDKARIAALADLATAVPEDIKTTSHAGWIGRWWRRLRDALQNRRP